MKHFIVIVICVILLLLGIRSFNFIEGKLKELSGWKTDLMFFSFMIFIFVIGIVLVVNIIPIFKELL